MRIKKKKKRKKINVKSSPRRCVYSESEFFCITRDVVMNAFCVKRAHSNARVRALYIVCMTSECEHNNAKKKKKPFFGRAYYGV